MLSENESNGASPFEAFRLMICKFTRNYIDCNASSVRSISLRWIVLIIYLRTIIPSCCAETYANICWDVPVLDIFKQTLAYHNLSKVSPNGISDPYSFEPLHCSFVLLWHFDTNPPASWCADHYILNSILQNGERFAAHWFDSIEMQESRLSDWTNRNPSALPRSAFHLLPASAPTMSVLSSPPKCCPATQHLPLSWMPFLVLPHLLPTPSLSLPAAPTNSVPILSIISSISTSLHSSTLLVTLQPNSSPNPFLTLFLQLGLWIPLLTRFQRINKILTLSFCLLGWQSVPRSPVPTSLLFILPTETMSAAIGCPS